MLSTEQWALIRNMHFTEGLSQREIARKLRLDRRTIKRAIETNDYSKINRIRKNRASKLDAYKGDITYLLQHYPGLSGQRIFEEIRKLGYTGGKSILKDYLKKVRPAKKEVFLRIETPPGEQAQVDWASCGMIKVGEGKRKLSAFVIVLSYSRMMYVEFTLSQKIDAFLEAHQNAFKFFGGVPKKILYDNLKSVVLDKFGRRINFNKTFLAFSGQYLFEPVLCNWGKANEKGKVENGIKYLKNNFLKGRFFRDYYDLTRQATHWVWEVANKRIHGTTKERPIDRFEGEKKVLQPLPSRLRDVFCILAVQSNSQSFVRFDGNSYSVPIKYASSKLTLKANSKKVNLFSGPERISSHKRSFEKNQFIEDPKHFEGLHKLKRKATAIKRRKEFLDLGEGAKSYLQGLLSAELNVDNHLKKIMELVKIYGKREILSAINFALQYQAFSSDYIKNIILQKRSKEGMKAIVNPLVIERKPELSDLSIEERDLSIYDRLFD